MGLKIFSRLPYLHRWAKPAAPLGFSQPLKSTQWDSKPQETLSGSKAAQGTYHTYRIEWLPDMVRWLVDSKEVRTETTLVPDKPMNLHFNIWVGGLGWYVSYPA